MGVDIF
jgi:hypothetical protein